MSRPARSRQETLEAFERAHAADAGGADVERTEFVLQLFIAGTRARSMRAVVNIKRICERHLRGRYRLDVVDLYQQPGLGRHEQVLAAPTLIKTEPAPIARLVGDLSDERRVLAGLGIRSEP